MRKRPGGPVRDRGGCGDKLPSKIDHRFRVLIFKVMSDQRVNMDGGAGGVGKNQRRSARCELAS